MEIKHRIAKLGKTQVDILCELRKQGIECQPPMLSSILSGAYTYPKARVILRNVESIVDKWEEDAR